MEEDVKRDIVCYRRQKAHDLIHDVDVLIDNELWNSTVNRMYYACYYMTTALLIKNGFQASTHSGVIRLLGLHFVSTGIISKDL